MYIDVHCHLDLLENVELAVSEARKKNVKLILTAGIDSKTNRKSLELAEKFEEVEAVLGIYPDECLKISGKGIETEIEFIRKNAEAVAAIGEVGLDFSSDITEREKKKQLNGFKKFIKLAVELNKPVVVHSRKAEKECIETLEALGAKKVVMHYFSGKMKLVEKIIKNGWFLSVPTAVKNSEHFQNVIRLADVKNLLCETDSPYSHPEKKFPNFPENVVESYKMIAKIKGLSLKEVEKIIEENLRKLSLNKET